VHRCIDRPGQRRGPIRSAKLGDRVTANDHCANHCRKVNIIANGNRSIIRRDESSVRNAPRETARLFSVSFVIFMSSRVFGKYYSALLLVRKVQSSTSGPAGRLPSTRLAGWSDSSLVLLVGLIYNVHYTNDVLSLSDTSPWSAKSFLFQSLKSCHSYSERPTSPSVDPNNHRFIGFDMYLFRRQKQIHRRHERSQKGNAEKTNTATCTR
jgi:hypothetical protein